MNEEDLVRVRATGGEPFCKILLTSLARRPLFLLTILFWV